MGDSKAARVALENTYLVNISIIQPCAKSIYRRQDVVLKAKGYCTVVCNILGVLNFKDIITLVQCFVYF
jgi:hypothetical protein